MSKSNEEKLGKTFVDFLKKANTTVDSDSVTMVINHIKNRICQSNHIDTNKVKIYVFTNKEINAFALPGDYMVIYAGMIDFCKNPEELASVMAHEIAHIENRHIVKKLTKEVGISVLATLAGGNSSNDIIKEIVKLISSTAFDRDMEREADTTAVRYLAKANIDPENFANVLFRLSQKTDVPENLEWVSTHPNSKERTAEILKLTKKQSFKAVPLVSDSTWENLKKEINKTDDDN